MSDLIRGAPTSAAATLAPQPDPIPASGDVWAEIVAELPEGHILRPLAEERRRQGSERYGVPLQRGNGRDHLVDALQEALDLMASLRAANWPMHTPAAPPCAIAEEIGR